MSYPFPTIPVLPRVAPVRVCALGLLMLLVAVFQTGCAPQGHFSSQSLPARITQDAPPITALATIQLPLIQSSQAMAFGEYKVVTATTPSNLIPQPRVAPSPGDNFDSPSSVKGTQQITPETTPLLANPLATPPVRAGITLRETNGTVTEPVIAALFAVFVVLSAMQIWFITVLFRRNNTLRTKRNNHLQRRVKAVHTRPLLTSPDPNTGSGGPPRSTTGAPIAVLVTTVPQATAALVKESALSVTQVELAQPVGKMEVPAENRIVRMSNCQAVALKPWTAGLKYEDRIFAGLLADRYPAVILADGASAFSLESNLSVSGGGGNVAETACLELKRELDTRLTGSGTLERVATDFASMFETIELKLDMHNRGNSTPGGTTLLAAFLYEPDSRAHRAFWIYGYLGNGEITLMNPRRQLNGWLHEDWLVSAHTDGNGTVVLPRSQAMRDFNPVIGMMPYSPHDILYVASDGLDEIRTYLHRKQRISVGNQLWRAFFASNGPITPPFAIPSLIEQIAQQYNANLSVSDDVCLSAIWTQGNEQ